MKANQNTISIEVLKSLESSIYLLLDKPEVWKSLDVDYYPPRVKRLWTTIGEYRVFLHTIYSTKSDCLYHKHRWPAAFRQLTGSYEMGITYSEAEISSDDARQLPTLAKFIINEGSYYEMTQTDSLHYVKPITNVSRSIMITKDMYPESSFRKEALDKKLEELPADEIPRILSKFKEEMKKFISVTTLTIEKVNFTGKWVEYWFKEDMKPVGEEGGYQISTKGSHLWNVVDDAGIYNEVMSNGFKGRKVTFEMVGQNYEIKSIE